MSPTADAVLAAAHARRARRTRLLTQAGASTAADAVAPGVSARLSADTGPRWTPLLRRRIERLVAGIAGEELVEVTDPVFAAVVGRELGFVGCPVVYLWVDRANRVRYVGKAVRGSGMSLSERASEHRRRHPAAASWVAVAAVWLAAGASDDVLGAVELRLIRALRPPDNVAGKPRPPAGRDVRRGQL